MPSQLAIHVEANPSIVRKLKLRWAKSAIVLVTCIAFTLHLQHLLLSQNGHIVNIARGTTISLAHMPEPIIKHIVAVRRRQCQHLCWWLIVVKVHENHLDCC